MMRLWSLHPKYLDTRGLTALWRDALDAQQILRGRTRTGKDSPQIQRFLVQEDPLDCIAVYLAAVAAEATLRGFEFDTLKIDPHPADVHIPVSEGQLLFELGHLRSKLAYRDRGRFEELGRVRMPDPHPLFSVQPGDIEAWETRKDE